MKKISLKLQLSLALFLYAIVLSAQEHSLSFLGKCIIAVASCAFFDSLYSFIKSKKFRITESSLITGLIIGFVLVSSASWWFFVLAGFLAINSKYFIRFKEKHIFNPAAAGIFSVVLIGNQATQWHGAFASYFIIPFGLYIAWRIRKISIVCAYFLMSIFLSAMYAYCSKRPFIDQIQYANYFFMFVMLIEPKTSPFGSRQKVVFGLLVSLSAFILYTVKFAYDADLPALLIGNLLFVLFGRKG
ncbi:MAG: RnfABCDGE type electron transport complex subunit D [Candidatus Omnitrophota bacterium]|nr:RnfABCDGE type electron transport complex subunit D [Candidatus Omnitrophota bacterium]